MAGTNPANVITEIDADYINSLGKEGLIHFYGGTDYGTPAKKPKHTHSVNGKPPTSDEQGDTFQTSGDVQQGKLDIVFAVQPQVGDILSVTGKLATKNYEFIANGGTPVGDQIALGTTITNTNTAVRTQLDADKTTLGIVSATVVGTVITQLLGETDGSALSASATTATAGSILVSVITPAIDGIAQYTIDFGGTPIPKSSVSFFQSFNLDNTDREIELVYYIQSGDTTPTLLATHVELVLQDLIDGVDPSISHHGEIIGLGDSSIDTLAAAAQVFYGSDSSLAVTRSTTKITLKALGGNINTDLFGARVDANQAPPTIPDVDQDTGIAQIPNVKVVTKFGKLKAAPKQNTQSIQTGSSTTADVLPSTDQILLSFELYNNLDLRTQILANLRSGKAYVEGKKTRVMTFNAGSIKKFLQGKQFLFTIQNAAGKYTKLKIHKVLLADNDFSFSPEATGVIPVTCLVQVVKGRLDGKGWAAEEY